MAKTASLLAATLAALCLYLPSAYAQNGSSSRAWVSGHGKDAAGCGAPTSPCRSFQYVLNNIVAPSGEIDVLDPAGYGAMTISHAVSVVNDGVGTAGVQAASGNAITINAGASDSVVLRGLNIEGVGAAANGVAFGSGASLIIANCVIDNFTNDGVIVNPNGVGVSSTVAIANVTLTRNGNDGLFFSPQIQASVSFDAASLIVQGNGNGVQVDASAGFVSGAITRSQITLNTVGLLATGGGFQWGTVVRDTVIKGSASVDINLQNSFGAGLYLFDGDTIGILFNSGVATSDGSNNIFALEGNALSTLARR